MLRNHNTFFAKILRQKAEIGNYSYENEKKGRNGFIFQFKHLIIKLCDDFYFPATARDKWEIVSLEITSKKSMLTLRRKSDKLVEKTYLELF